jgi:predicted ATPase
LQRLNPAVKNVDLIALQKPAKIMVSQQVKDKVLVLELAQQSEGLRRFLAYFIALYQSPPKQTLIFEEPEKGIHPGALAVLADQFKAYASSGRGQVILTTHSPQLLDYFAPENIRVVEIDNYQTRIGPLAPEQLESLKEKLLRPGELLTVDYARAEPARA